MPRRRHPRAAWVAAVVLPVLAPGALALATGEDDPTATTPASTPPVLVAEHTATARNVVPFGIATGAEGQRTIWAFGRTRPASTLDGTTPVPPPASTPSDAVLLEGTARDAGDPTGWRRAAPPLDVTGAEMASGAWRVADGTDAPVRGTTPPAASVMHSGQATPKGAAALLVRYAPPGGGAPRTTILVRTNDRRFRELPAPPAELLAPAGDAFAGPDGELVPFAVTDAAPGDAPADDAPERGRTAVFLAPAGSDGVLRWDGARWTEEPWADADGAPSGPRTPLNLAATPTGEVVALFAGDATSPTGARVRLARRNAASATFAPVTVVGTTPLLDGALPNGITSIRPAPRPGVALTISPKHWWIDLLVTRSDEARVSATVHVRPPGVREPGTTPDPTSPAPTGPAPTGPAPTASTPSTSPAATPAQSPDPSSPSTPTTPEPTTPTDAEATGTWCGPTLPGGAACDHDLGFRFATARGWSSAAFDGPGRFGERAISSPVIPEAEGATTPREASASGGFLQLTGTTFALRSGVGDDGTNDTQAARFASGGFAVTGGVQAVGRTVPRKAARESELRSTFSGLPDGVVDLAVSPPGTPPKLRGAIALSVAMGLLRQQGDRDWTGIDLRLTERGRPAAVGARRAAPHAVAWLAPDRMILAGPAGLLVESDVAEVVPPYGRYENPKPVTNVDIGADDLLDVAGRGDDALAVGRGGAAWRRGGGRWRRVPVDTAGNVTMTSIAYAGDQPIVASTRGVLTIDPTTGALTVDPDLASLMRDDGRPVAAEMVAGLPDGAAVVDGRYVRAQAGTPWKRLASPLEGDVVALALWREPGASSPAVPPASDPSSPSTTSTPSPTSVVAADELGDLRIAASVADERRPAQGTTREMQDGPRAEDRVAYEQPPMVSDGRPVTFGPTGWVDRARTPAVRSNANDLATQTPAIASIATDEAGNGWMAGGRGSIDDLFFGTTREVPELFLAALGASPLDLRPADERPVQDRSGRQVTDIPATTPQPAGDDPQPAGDRPTTVRVLVGGHPACLSECAGRGDQGLAPDATLNDALVTAERVAAPGQGSAPALVVIGGGRTAQGGDGLSRAGASRYLEALRAHPTVPVALAIGSGDAVTAESRANFADAARQVLRERTGPGSPLTKVTEPESPIDRRGASTVAYAIDGETVDGDGDRVAGARILVIDNAGGELRGGPTGEQARWLRESLDTATIESRTTIVVGAARLDGAGGIQAKDREDELTLLGSGGADVYIATDGVDDPSSQFFGDQTVRYPTDRAHGQPIAMYRTSALGHQRRGGIYAGLLDRQEDDIPDATVGWLSPALLDLNVGPTAGALDVALLPVLSSILPQELDFQAGSAEPLVITGLTRATTGMRIPRPTDEPDAAQPPGTDGPPLIDDPSSDDDPPVGTTPGPTTPEPTTPEVAAGEMIDTRAPGWVFASPLPCRFFGDEDECRGQVPIDATYDVVDPSIAVFVRARPPKKDNAPPTIVTDQNGDPVVDRSSSVICPLRPGLTTVVVRVAGRTAVYPLRVAEPGGRRPASSEGKQAACAFRWSTPAETSEERPNATTPEAPAPPVAAEPGAEPELAPRPEPRVPVPAARPITPLVAAAPFRPLGTLNGAAPPVAPNPKPASPGAPPAPPSGVSTQQVPAHQSSVQVQSSAVQQTVGVTAEERRAEVAREGADYQASRLSHESAVAEARRQTPGDAGAGARHAQAAPGAEPEAPGRAPATASDAIDASPTYRSTDGGPAVPLVAGGILAMLAALAGHAAGRQRRRRAAARRRSWLR